MCVRFETFRAFFGHKTSSLTDHGHILGEYAYGLFFFHKLPTQNRGVTALSICVIKPEIKGLITNSTSGFPIEITFILTCYTFVMHLLGSSRANKQIRHSEADSVEKFQWSIA
jgi:hypothetical protein